MKHPFRVGYLSFACLMAVSRLIAETITPGDASRFLMQATYGPTDEEIARVQQLGYGPWIDDQLTRAPQKHLPVIEAMKEKVEGAKIYGQHRKFAWWQQSVTADDQLRQRMAYAWSQLFVISDTNDFLGNRPFGMTDYYDLLLVNGLGNFYDLLKAVTYHPCMGIYLTYLHNPKGDPNGTRRPDENYAREVMQLFTIGLNELNLDGSLKLRKGQPISTYNNDDIQEMARVFTGMCYAGSGENFHWGKEELFKPLEINPKFHDSGRKVLLGGRATIPADQSPDKDIEDALKCLFNHPNTPPFVCRFLIQRFTTSNPSPSYLSRVARVFENNGKGVRGDMSAVLKAILLDPEARNHGEHVDTGKQREPYLRLVALVRAFNGRPKDREGLFQVAWLGPLLGQEPGSAPTVFNFYRPDYSPPGPIAESGLVGPEFQITDAVTSVSLPNFTRSCLYQGAIGRWGKNLVLDFSKETPWAAQPNTLVDRLSLLLTGNRMSDQTRKIIIGAVQQVPETKPEDRVKLAVYLTSICPESAVQP